MITCNLMGGLGNQIFQIFATISYGIKSSNQFKFLDLETLGGGSSTLRYTFWETFFVNLKPFLVTEFPSVQVIKENGFTYKPLSVIEMVNKNIMINGYFQSYKYFQENYAIIYRLLNIDKMKNDLLNNLNFSSPEYLNLENTVSMHFRIGDYKKFPDVHPLATYDFYERSLLHIKNSNPDKEFNILYFCEDDDIDEVLVTINKLSNNDLKYICQNIQLRKYYIHLHLILANQIFQFVIAILLPLAFPFRNCACSSRLLLPPLFLRSDDDNRSGSSSRSCPRRPLLL